MKTRRKLGWIGMQNVREILRLHAQGLNYTQIGVAVNSHRCTAREYVILARTREITFERALAMTDEELRSAFEKKSPGRKVKDTQLDFAAIERELKRPGVTLVTLWEEYLKENPGGYRYSQFAARVQAWRKLHKLEMRRVYKAGDLMMVDYAGMTISWKGVGDTETNEAQIFIGILAASSLTYVEASASQTLPDWLGSHTRTLEYFGGVPNACVIDNLKSGVTAASYYEPQINRTYAEWARHYKIAVLPTRAAEPRDKGKCEGAVRIVEQSILARLRNRQFRSIAEINQAIRPLLEELNNRKMQEYGCSRRDLYNDLEKSALKPLPADRYEFAFWRKAKVHIDYHIEFKSHYYSVPYKLVGKQIELRVKEKVIDVFYNNVLVGTHLRSSRKGFFSTIREHMPPEHRYNERWSSETFLSWALKEGGPATRTQVDAILKSRQFPEQAFRACLGIMRLIKQFGKERAEAACRRANELGIASFQSINSMLKTGADQIPSSCVTESPPSPHVHSNIRGSGEFQ
jgi:transposase